MVQIPKGKALDLAELRFAQLRAKALARQSGQSGVGQSQQQGEEGAYRHLDPFNQYVVGVPGGDANVDDIRHNQGNHQLENRFQHDTQTAENQMQPVFVKVSGKEDAYYGQLYKKRKELETFKNKNFEYAEQAKAQLTSKNYRDGTVTKDYLEKGMLSPAQIHARARRYAVKIFLSHLHEVMYKVTLGKKPPAPFAIAILGHAHVLEVPNPQYIREFVEPVEVDPTVESDED